MTAALSLDGIVKRYGTRAVIDGVSLEIAPGETLGLLGPNGAGKTTLLKIIAGLCAPSAGTAHIFGADALCCRKAVNARVGLVPQGNNLEREFTVREALISYAKLFGVRNCAARLTEVTGALRMESWLERKVDRLSGGMARRAMIARALLPRPDLLLLDEPSVGLDPDVRREIWSVVRQLQTEGVTLILTTHYMDEADALCDRIALLKGGRVLRTATAAALKAEAAVEGREATLEEAFLQLLRKGGA